MISYYKSSYPGLFVYLFLVTVSVLSFLFFEIKASHVGILSIVWGVFILIRIVSLYEINKFFVRYIQSEDRVEASAILPNNLIRHKDNRKRLKEGNLAICAMHERTVLWLILGLAYAGYHFYLLHNTISQSVLIKDLAVFFIVGAVFWMGQTYAQSSHASKFLFFVFSLCFGFTLFRIDGVVADNVPKTLMLLSLSSLRESALPILSILMIYSAITLFHSFRQSVWHNINIILGLGLICSVVTYSVFFTLSAQDVTALWVSGLSLFSVFWINAYHIRHRRYILYQCE